MPLTGAGARKNGRVEGPGRLPGRGGSACTVVSNMGKGRRRMLVLAEGAAREEVQREVSLDRTRSQCRDKQHGIPESQDGAVGRAWPSEGWGRPRVATC